MNLRRVVNIILFINNKINLTFHKWGEVETLRKSLNRKGTQKSLNRKGTPWILGVT